MTDLRSLGFLVADKNMQACLRGFFERDRWDLALGCGRFEFNTEIPGDIYVAAGEHDPGLYSHGTELLSAFERRYEHFVVMMDAQWDGSPGADAIRNRMREHLTQAGWATDDCHAVVLEPEVDLWLWTGTDHTAKAMGWDSWSDLQTGLIGNGFLSPGQTKPQRPKEAAEWALRAKGKPRTSGVYHRISSVASLTRHACEPSLLELMETLRRWFPKIPRLSA